MSTVEAKNNARVFPNVNVKGILEAIIHRIVLSVHHFKHCKPHLLFAKT